MVVAGGDDHGAAGQLAAAGGAQQPAVTTRGGLDARDLDARDDLQLVVLGVLLQVAHHVVAGDPPPEGARHREAGQAGQPPGRVQVQPVVVAPPGRPDLVGLLQYDGPYALGAQRVRRRESPGPPPMTYTGRSSWDGTGRGVEEAVESAMCASVITSSLDRSRSSPESVAN